MFGRRKKNKFDEVLTLCEGKDIKIWIPPGHILVRQWQREWVSKERERATRWRGYDFGGMSGTVLAVHIKESGQVKPGDYVNFWTPGACSPISLMEGSPRSVLVPLDQVRVILRGADVEDPEPKDDDFIVLEKKEESPEPEEE